MWENSSELKYHISFIYKEKKRSLKIPKDKTMIYFFFNSVQRKTQHKLDTFAHRPDSHALENRILTFSGRQFKLNMI